ncbi:MAG TPA: GMC family oxidoreductase [Acidobacteriota bacterium]|nr:GMC family oxidoreductase [Acidobacteriota bacterium]
MHRSPEYDVVIIGSGFGGACTAAALVRAGKRVLMLERGDWVQRGPHNWEPDGSLDLTPYYSKETPYDVAPGSDTTASLLDRLVTGRTKTKEVGGYHCVGGPSVFYGAVSLRLRVEDFEPAAEIRGDSEAEWPYRYEEIEPFYAAAEDLLGVAGVAGQDPTEPPRSGPYGAAPAELSDTSRMIGDAARRLGLQPFQLPLAINYEATDSRAGCVACTTCDSFACAIGAKNDVATRVLPPLLDEGMELRAGVVVTRLVRDGARIRAVECVDRTSGEELTFRGRQIVLAAGALASPLLLLASELERVNPGGDAVGRYLTRHSNAIEFGLFRSPVNPKEQFHKQIGFHDFYFGHPDVRSPIGKLGGIQQLQSPPVGLVKAHLPPLVGELVGALLIPRTTGLLVMAEDEPRADNQIRVDGSRRDQFGLPRAVIRHAYTARDLAARDALLGQSRRILREAGAVWTYSHYIHTFSHAAGTVRMGSDPATSVVDAHGRFRGVENLRVVDASVIPAGGGLNPSLTIAANALRVGEHLLGDL